MLDLTPEYMRNCLNYDPITGLFMWKRRYDMSPQWNGRFAHKAAFNTINKIGYVIGTVNSKRLLAHRAAWAIYYGEWPDDIIDHIDGNPLNNRIENLRPASKSTNAMNRGVQKNNASGIKGLHYDNKRCKWVAQLSSNGRRVLMKRFDSIEDAVKSHNAASVMYHGEFHKC